MTPIDIIIESKKIPEIMPPYNWYELGAIRNVPEEEQISFCNESIYQIIPVKYLIKIILNRKLRFNNILKSWEDPYELFLLKHNITVEGYPETDFFTGFQKFYYGQCWTLNRDTDAMWRIYSPDKESVRIKTSVIKMIRVLDNVRAMMWYCPYFGRVQYVEQISLYDWIKNVLNEGSGRIYDAFTESLFMKRSEFSHEKEVRFLIQRPKEDSDQKLSNVYLDHIDMQLDPFTFIEEIALDPRLSDEDFEDRKAMLTSITKEIPICKSDLYSYTPQVFKIKESQMHVKIIFHNDKSNSHS